MKDKEADRVMNDKEADRVMNDKEADRVMNDKEADRVMSFSCKPYDKEALDAIADLKQYGKYRGISFSYLVIAAIKLALKALKE